MTERIVLGGTSNFLKPVITQVMAMHQMLEQLDFEGEGYHENFDPGRKYHPKITLYFREDTDFKKGTGQQKGRGQDRTKGRLSFRLMDETTETISSASLEALGQKLKTTFGDSGGYVWQKGKELYTYADWSKGYQLSMLCKTESQARDLTSKILGLQNHSPIWKYLSVSESCDEINKYPATKEKKWILGEEVELPLRRPNADVRFLYATARVNPLVKSTVVYDRTSKKVGALVR